MKLRMWTLVLNWVLLVGVIGYQALEATLFWLTGCPPQSVNASEDTLPSWSLAPPGPVCEVRVATGYHVDGPTWYPVVLVAMAIVNIACLSLLGRPQQRPAGDVPAQV